MKNSLLKLFAVGMLCATSISAQTHKFDFESYETTPYLFRFGNKGKKGEHTYKPRWMYSHIVRDNSEKNADNSSNKVLHYTSQEAQNYGLKFRFPTPVPINQMKEVRFKIFQPANVIGKAYDPAYSSASPSKQQITVKLLSAFNAVVDFTQDEGILMYLATVDNTETGVWKTFSFMFNSSDYSSQLGKFANGVIGVAILPTYGAATTLSESDMYECYIDDIEINPTPLAIGAALSENFSVRYTDGMLRIQSDISDRAVIQVANANGSILYRTPFMLESGECNLPLALNSGLYFVSIESADNSYTCKIIVRP